MFSKLLNFDEMVAPFLIKIIYWICLVGVAITAIGTVIAGMMSGGGVGGTIVGLIGGLIVGVLVLVIGVLTVRLYSEMMIVAFEIHKNLVELNQKTK